MKKLLILIIGIIIGVSIMFFGKNDCISEITEFKKLDGTKSIEVALNKDCSIYVRSLDDQLKEINTNK